MIPSRLSFCRLLSKERNKRTTKHHVRNVLYTTASITTITTTTTTTTTTTIIDNDRGSPQFGSPASFSSPLWRFVGEVY